MAWLGRRIGRNLQYGRPTQAAVGEEQLLAEVSLAGGGHYLGCNSGQAGVVGQILRIEGERHERGAAGLEVDAKLLRDLIAKRGGARSSGSTNRRWQ